MALNKLHKYLHFIFAFGTAFLLYSIAAYYIDQSVGKLPVAAFLLAIVLLTICIVSVRKASQRTSKSYEWKKKGMLIAVIILAGIIWSGINLSAYTFNKRWDLTLAKQHTLSANTVELINGLASKIQLTAFYVGIPPKYLEDMFKEYERLSRGKVKTEIIDPIVQIGYASKFGNVISGKEKKVIVQSGGERKDIDFTDDVLSEEQLVNAILSVTREARKIYFLTGHREYSFNDEGDNGLSILSKLLSTNNISSNELMLGRETEIPDDCDVLIIAGPHDFLTEKEEAAIDEYLKRGGDALFLIEHIIVTTPDKPLLEAELDKNPSLNNILNEWGVNVGNDMVVDAASHASGDAGSPATRNYITHKAITENLDYTFYVRPRSISVLEKRRKSIKIAPIVYTASEENSWAETNRTMEIRFDEKEDTPGPVPIAFVILDPASQTTKGMESQVSGAHLDQDTGKDKISDTRIIVFTDADFLTNVFINQYSNAAMGLNVINWLSDLDYKAFLDQKEIKVYRFDLSSKQNRIIVIVLFLMPVLIATIGVMTWLRRKN